MKQKLPIKINQNFLHDDNLVEQLLNLSNITRTDLVIEIGGGAGIITDSLMRRCSQLIVFENDPRWYRHLINKYSDCQSVQVRLEDFLDYRLPNAHFKVFASIPYDQTAAIIRKLTEIGDFLQVAYLIMQKEAAEKYTGQPYRPETLRSLLLKANYRAEIIRPLDRKDFKPAPAVDSVLWHIEQSETTIDQPQYADFLTSVFLHKGDTIKTRFSHLFSYTQLKRLARAHGFSINGAWQALSFSQWLGLYEFFSQHIKDKHHQVNGAYGKLSREQQQLEKRHRSIRR